MKWLFIFYYILLRIIVLINLILEKNKKMMLDLISVKSLATLLIRHRSIYTGSVCNLLLIQYNNNCIII